MTTPTCAACGRFVAVADLFTIIMRWPGHEPYEVDAWYHPLADGSELPCGPVRGDVPAIVLHTAEEVAERLAS